MSKLDAEVVYDQKRKKSDCWYYVAGGRSLANKSDWLFFDSSYNSEKIHSLEPNPFLLPGTPSLSSIHC